MPNKKFLEEYPLYRKFRLGFKDTYVRNLPKPAIHMFCKKCDSEQTFNMVNEYDEIDYAMTSWAGEKVFRLKYVCNSCDEFLRFFFIKIQNEDSKTKDDSIYAVKIGQFPPWDINPNKKFTKFLGDYEDYYKKALVCESQSYGIGAYAYYRRIIEGIIDELLEIIADFLETDKKIEQYKETLDKVKKEKVAQKKIKLVNGMLPASLCPDGLNPLSVLHDALSIGLHGESDEECMEKAEIIKGVLIYLVNEIIGKKANMNKFTTDIRKILDKNNKK
jgi:hypothetical protein